MWSLKPKRKQNEFPLKSHQGREQGGGEEPSCAPCVRRECSPIHSFFPSAPIYGTLARSREQVPPSRIPPPRAKDPGKLRSGPAPKTAGQRPPTPPLPTPGTEVGHCPGPQVQRELSRGRNLSLGSEGRLPPLSACGSVPGKSSVGGGEWEEGRRAPAGCAPAPFPALTPMATEKYLFRAEELQRPPSESRVIGEIKIDPLRAHTWPCSGRPGRLGTRGVRGAQPTGARCLLRRKTIEAANRGEEDRHSPPGVCSGSSRTLASLCH